MNYEGPEAPTHNVELIAAKHKHNEKRMAELMNNNNRLSNVIALNKNAAKPTHRAAIVSTSCASPRCNAVISSTTGSSLRVLRWCANANRAFELSPSSG